MVLRVGYMIIVHSLTFVALMGGLLKILNVSMCMNTTYLSTRPGGDDLCMCVCEVVYELKCVYVYVYVGNGDGVRVTE